MVVRLPEIYSQTLFKRYLSWIHTDIVTVKETTSERAGVMNMSSLIRLYLLGDFLDDIRLRNATIRALTKYGICPSVENCNLIFEQTTPASPLRKWTADAIIFLAHRYKFEAMSVLYDNDLMLQIAIMLMHRRTKGVDKYRILERRAKDYATWLWDDAMSNEDRQLKELIVGKIASGLSAKVFEKVALWPAELTLQLARKLMKERSHNGTDLEGLVDRIPNYEEATRASDIVDSNEGGSTEA